MNADCEAFIVVNKMVTTATREQTSAVSESLGAVNVCRLPSDGTVHSLARESVGHSHARVHKKHERKYATKLVQRKFINNNLPSNPSSHRFSLELRTNKFFTIYCVINHLLHI